MPLLTFRTSLVTLNLNKSWLFHTKRKELCFSFFSNSWTPFFFHKPNYILFLDSVSSAHTHTHTYSNLFASLWLFLYFLMSVTHPIIYTYIYIYILCGYPDFLLKYNSSLQFLLSTLNSYFSKINSNILIPKYLTFLLTKFLSISIQ